MEIQVTLALVLETDALHRLSATLESSRWLNEAWFFPWPHGLQRLMWPPVFVASWNINSIRTRGEQLCQWLDEHAPDVLALQETRVADRDFPYDAIRSRGYEAAHAPGVRGRAGVALLFGSTCIGASAVFTPCRQLGQAYFGRTCSTMNSDAGV